MSGLPRRSFRHAPHGSSPVSTQQLLRRGLETTSQSYDFMGFTAVFRVYAGFIVSGAFRAGLETTSVSGFEAF